MTPDLYLATGFTFDARGRIASTREPFARRGPLFTLVRGALESAWAIRADVADDVARKLGRAAGAEPGANDLRAAPLRAPQLADILRPAASTLVLTSGPAFSFPRELYPALDAIEVVEERPLAAHFSGWRAGEIEGGRAPVMAIVEGAPVSVCFCARRSDAAAEAGVETAPAYRGRGYAARVVAAWARAVRASGRTPLYSTTWGNAASLAVARKLALEMYASWWSVSD